MFGTLVALLLLLPALLVAPALIVVFSRLSGWQTLARRYPLRGSRPPARVRLGFGVFRRWIGYNGGLVVAVDGRGLYLAAMPVVLSFCHPPIFIPWSEIVWIRRDRLLGFITLYRIRARQAPDVDFALRARTFARIREDVHRAGVPGDY
jgi:hypothetical protein